MGILIFAWVPFVVRVVQLYVSANFQQAAFFAPTADTFRQFLEQQDFFVFVITVYVGAGLIANDRRANALQIYLSKPLMRTEYIAGKLAVLFVFLTLVTLVPALLLLLLQGMFAGTFAFLRNNLFLIPAITMSHIDGGVTGTLRAEARDDAAAENLRQVVQGFLALGRLQSQKDPKISALLQSLQLTGTGKTVALSFAIPSEIFDMPTTALVRGRGCCRRRR